MIRYVMWPVVRSRDLVPALMALSTPVPFVFHIPDSRVERMKRQVQDFELPATPAVPGASWEYGVDLEWLTKIQDHWVNKFDWRAAEAKLNQLSFTHNYHFLVIARLIFTL